MVTGPIQPSNVRICHDTSRQVRRDMGEQDASPFASLLDAFDGNACADEEDDAAESLSNDKSQPFAPDGVTAVVIQNIGQVPEAPAGPLREAAEFPPLHIPEPHNSLSAFSGTTGTPALGGSRPPAPDLQTAETSTERHNVDSKTDTPHSRFTPHVEGQTQHGTGRGAPSLGHEEPAAGPQRTSHGLEESDANGNSRAEKLPMELRDSVIPPKPDIVTGGAVNAPAVPPASRQLMVQLEAVLKSRSVSTGSPLQTLSSGGEVKILRMKLKPELLGEVDVMLRRVGGEMRIHITVAKQAAADALQGDLAFLSDRICGLVPSEAAPAITLYVQSSDGNVPSPILHRNSSSDTGAATSNGGPAAGGGDRPTPRKDEPRSNNATNEALERDSLLQPGIAHIVV